MIAIVAAVFMVFSWWFVQYSTDDKRDVVDLSGEKTLVKNIASSDVNAEQGVVGTGGNDAERLVKLAIFYQDRYGPRLESPYWQVKMLDKLVADFRQRYPDDWLNQLQLFLQVSFVDNYTLLQERLEAFLSYDEWLKNLPLIDFSSAQERQDSIWQERLILFGEDAYKIWGREYQEKQFSQAVAEIERDDTLSLDHRLSTYTKIYENTLGQESQLNSDGDRGQLLTRFLSLTSVQKDLNGLSAQNRVEALSELRKDIGMSAAAIERWKELDLTRQAQRERGAAYLQAIAEITPGVTNKKLQYERSRIRRQIFGEQVAERIGQEEAAGFYRFQTPVVHGVN